MLEILAWAGIGVFAVGFIGMMVAMWRDIGACGFVTVWGLVLCIIGMMAWVSWAVVFLWGR